MCDATPLGRTALRGQTQGPSDSELISARPVNARPVLSLDEARFVSVVALADKPGYFQEFCRRSSRMPLAKRTFDEAVRSEKYQMADFSTNTRLEPKLFRCGFANYASVLAVPARCSTNRRVCAGSASLRRTQTINCRTAQVSVSRSVLSAMVR